MQFHIVIEGEKRGPFAGFRIIELLRTGEVSPDALAWETGMEEWKKLRDIPSFAEVIEVLENPPESEPPEKETTDSPVSGHSIEKAGVATEAEKKVGTLKLAGEARPFIRFWARSFDYMLVSLVALLFVDLPPIPYVEGEPIPFEALMEYVRSAEYQQAIQKQHMALILWHVIEGVLLHLLGTTPGKAIFGIQLRDANGGPLSIGKGIGRAYLVWFVGFGLGLPFINFIAMGIGLFMLLFTGATYWDRRLDVQVRHSPLTPSRILMAIGGFFLLMIISSFKFS